MRFGSVVAGLLPLVVMAACSTFASSVEEDGDSPSIASGDATAVFDTFFDNQAPREATPPAPPPPPPRDSGSLDVVVQPADAAPPKDSTTDSALEKTDADAALQPGPLTYRDVSVTRVRSESTILTHPPPVVREGDLLVAILTISNTTPPYPQLSAPIPPGWKLESSKYNADGFEAHYVYSHVYVTGEVEYTWQTTQTANGFVWIAALANAGGVYAPSSRFDQIPNDLMNSPTPVGDVNDIVLFVWTGHNIDAPNCFWTVPGVTERSSVSNSGQEVGWLGDLKVLAASNLTLRTASFHQSPRNFDFAGATVVTIKPKM